MYGGHELAGVLLHVLRSRADDLRRQLVVRQEVVVQRIDIDRAGVPPVGGAGGAPQAATGVDRIGQGGAGGEVFDEGGRRVMIMGRLGELGRELPEEARKAPIS